MSSREPSPITFPQEVVTPPDVRGRTKKEKPGETESRLRLKLEDLFVESFSHFVEHHELPPDEFEVSRFDETDHLLDVLECPMADDHGYFTPEQRQRIPYFFDELYHFVREQRRDPEARGQLMGFLDAWREKAFSVSPNIFNYMTLEDELTTAARFSRLPETQSNMGWINTGELVYNLAYMRGEKGEDPRVTFLQHAFDKASPEARLDLIHFLADIGTDALGQDWAEEAGYAVIDFLSRLEQDETQSPFVHYAAETTHEVLRSSLDPQNGEGDFASEDDEPVPRRSNAWIAQIRKEDHDLGTQIAQDATSYKEPIFRRISRDTIAGFDCNLVPQSFANVSREVDAPREHVPSAQDIDYGIELLKQPSARFPRNMSAIVEFLDEKVFKILPKNHWEAYWNSQKRFPNDPDFISVVSQELGSLRQRLGYQGVHFEPFDSVAGDELVQRKAVSIAMDVPMLLQELHRPAIREAFEEDVGISLADVSLREQIQLLSYLARVDSGTAQKGFATIREHGLNGARSFLSCEYGKEYGDAILKIAEKLEPEAADAIFQKYTELIDLTEQSTNELLKDVVVAERQQSVDRTKLDEELLRRGKELIGAYAKKIGKKNGDISSAQIIEELERAKQDVVLLAALFRSAYKGRESVADFSEVKGLAFETVNPEEMTVAQREKFRKELTDILKANWAEKGISAMEIALHGLEEGLSRTEGQTKFSVLRKDDVVIAFVRFDDRPDIGQNAQYVGSFNVSPDLRSSAIGISFFHEVLKREGREHDLYAHVLADDRVGARYVEDFGFEITGVETEKSSEGVQTDWFAIRRPQYDEDAAPISGTQRQPASEAKIFRFPAERELMLKWIASETKSGNSIRHYTVASSDGEEDVRSFTPVRVRAVAEAA